MAPAQSIGLQDLPHLYTEILIWEILEARYGLPYNKFALVIQEEAGIARAECDFHSLETHKAGHITSITARMIIMCASRPDIADSLKTYRRMGHRVDLGPI